MVSKLEKWRSVLSSHADNDLPKTQISQQLRLFAGEMYSTVNEIGLPGDHFGLGLTYRSTFGEDMCEKDFYRAMHFSAKRSHVVCLSVRLSVCL